MKLSVIIPAFNEADRVPKTIEKIFINLKKNFKEGFEVIIANDGSGDDTGLRVEQMRASYPELRHLDYKENQGRGAVCKKAVFETSGEYILITDADGSTDEKFIVPFSRYLDKNPETDLLIGSRDMKGARILTPQTWFRVLLNRVFLFMAMMMFGWSMHDRVNGFKMFRREVALDVYPKQTETSFFAEAELVYIAEQRGWKVKELPIEWTDDRDSRVKPVREAWSSFWGMFKIMSRGFRGTYKR